MAKDFYTEWLGIPPGVRPPDHYTLLGVPRFSKDMDAVETATRARLTRLDEYAMHPHRATRDAVQDMMNAVARARVDVVNPRRCKAYDEELARKFGVAMPPAAETREQPAPRPTVTDTTVARVEPPAQRRRPAVPVAAEPAPQPPTPVLEPLSAEESVREFERVVWAHLRRWRVSAHEERLLVAEAATFNIDVDQAMDIIHRIEREAEARARKESRRTTAIIAGFAFAVVVVLVVVVACTRWLGGMREGQRAFEASISQVRECLKKEDLQGARKHLARARDLQPGDRELAILEAELKAKREDLTKRSTSLLAQALVLMRRGELKNAGGTLARAREIVSRSFAGDQGLASGLRQGEEELSRRRPFEARLAEAQAASAKGNSELVENKLKEAEQLFPNDRRVTEVRADLDARRNAALAEKRKKETFEACLADVREALDRGDVQLAQKKLDKAEQLYPNDLRAQKIRVRVEATRKAALAEKRKKEGLTLDLGDGVSMRLRWIPAGNFLMGSPNSDTNASSDEKPQRTVTISPGAPGFYLGITEVTQAQFKAVMDTQPWAGESYAKAGADNAASHISWGAAAGFCKALSKKTERTVRLPTEAEWEYACRAGSETVYCFGDDASKLGDYAWYVKNAWAIGEKYAHAVGQKKPNAWGLYDMHGNVWEWCGDWYDKAYYAAGGNAVDPTGPASGSSRVLRGGSFHYLDGICRSAYRIGRHPVSRLINVGFRVVLPVVGRGLPR